MQPLGDQRDGGAHAGRHAVALRHPQRDREMQRQRGRVVGAQRDLHRLAQRQRLGHHSRHGVFVLAARGSVAAVQRHVSVGDHPLHPRARRGAGAGLQRQPRPVEPREALGVGRKRGRLEQVAHADQAGDLGAGGAGQHVLRRSLLQGAPLAQHHQPVGQPRRLVHVMRHQRDRHGQPGAQLGDLAIQPLARGAVHGGERLVHEQRARRAGQRAGDGDALLLAARQLRRAAVLQPGEVDHRQQRLRLRRTRGAGNMAHGGGHVVARAHVRKQRVGLEHHAHGAAVRGQEHAPVRVEPDLALRRDPPARRPRQPRDGAQDGGLARP